MVVCLHDANVGGVYTTNVIRFGHLLVHFGHYCGFVRFGHIACGERTVFWLFLYFKLWGEAFLYEKRLVGSYFFLSVKVFAEKERLWRFFFIHSLKRLFISDIRLFIWDIIGFLSVLEVVFVGNGQFFGSFVLIRMMSKLKWLN
jgi:hypothetical protein